MKPLAKELVELSPDILVAYTTPSVKALQQVTSSIPIVFLSVTDPLGQGIVASLAKPSENITGFAVFEFSLGSKWLETLRQIAPNITRVAILFNPETAPTTHYTCARSRTLDIHLRSSRLLWSFTRKPT
jgi:putative ABC transport system substrate-binding protein